MYVCKVFLLYLGREVNLSVQNIDLLFVYGDELGPLVVAVDGGAGVRVLHLLPSHPRAFRRKKEEEEEVRVERE